MAPYSSSGSIIAPKLLPKLKNSADQLQRFDFQFSIKLRRGAHVSIEEGTCFLCLCDIYTPQYCTVPMLTACIIIIAEITTKSGLFYQVLIMAN